MLETQSLTIRFGGHAAVDGVSCAFEKGTLTSIVGPNGAGKTTYFNLISGQLPATSGKVTLNGEDITSYAAPRRTRLGLGRAFQLTNLFPNLSALENVRLAVQEMYHWRMKKDAPDNYDLLELVRVIPADEMKLPIKNKR